MQLPMDIEAEVAAYLRTEFGESGKGGALHVKDLTPLGERVIEGVRKHVWQFDTSTGPMWVTVEPCEGSYAIGTCEPVLRGADRSGVPVLRITGGKSTRRHELVRVDDDLYAADVEVGSKKATSQRFTVSAEVIEAGREATISILVGAEPIVEIRAGLPCTVVWADCMIDLRIEPS